MVGFDATIRHLKDHRGQAVTVRLLHWKPDVGIKLTAAIDDPETKAAGRPTHDYLTASSATGASHGYPRRSNSSAMTGNCATPQASPISTCPLAFSYHLLRASSLPVHATIPILGREPGKDLLRFARPPAVAGTRVVPPVDGLLTPSTRAPDVGVRLGQTQVEQTPGGDTQPARHLGHRQVPLTHARPGEVPRPDPAAPRTARTGPPSMGRR